MSFQRSVELLTSSVCTTMHRHTPPCWGKGAQLPQRGHDSKKLKPPQSSKMTFIYSKNNFNYKKKLGYLAQVNENSRNSDHTSYLCVPGIMKDRISTTPFGLGGKMMVFFIAIPSPFPEIKSQGGKKEKSNNSSFRHLKL